MAKANLTKNNKLPKANAQHRNRWVILIICVGLAAGIITAYEPIRHNSFVGYDDIDYIVKNPHVNSGITQESLIWAFTKSYASNWHPLTWISHMLDCQLFGLNPVGHHLVSVGIHIANTILLFWILTKLTNAMWASAFVAAVFALHPVQVESVAWAAGRKTVLSGLFWFLTIALYARYTKRPGLGRYILVLLMFGLGVMTKPVVVTLPLVLLLLDYWPLERIGEPSFAKAAEGRHKASLKWLIIEKIPLLAMAVILSVVTFIAQKGGGAISTIEIIPLDQRVANAFLSYITYIAKAVWPSALAVYHTQPHAGFTVITTICAVLFLAISLFCVYIGRRKKYMVVGWLWFVGTLIPMIGLVQVGAQAIAYRYLYLSILGLLIIIAWSTKDAVADKVSRKIAAAVLSITVLIILIALTRIQVGHWQNSITLFDYTLKVTKNNPSAEHNYGCALFQAGRYDEAEVHLKNAIRMVPIFYEARNNLGKAYMKDGKVNEAIECFEELVRMTNVPAEVHYNLATSLLMQKRYDEAIKQLNEALAINPGYPHAPSTLGIVLLQAGRLEESNACFEKYLKQNNNSTELHFNFAIALLMQKNYNDAVNHFNIVIKLDPAYTEALNGLARAQDAIGIEYADAGNYDAAKAAAEKALNSAKAAGQAELVRDIEERLQLYKKGLPYKGK
jgi:protein O-mannosyl-transferase